MMKRVAWGLLILPTALAAQMPGFDDAQRAEGLRQVQAVGKLLADSLRDPTGARFRNVRLFKTVGTDGRTHVTVCGEVNAKNGFGGMTGFEGFTAVGDHLMTGSTGILNADMICKGSTPRVWDERDYTPELRKAFDSNAGQ